MVRKEDVVSWFKELESYKRIDAMCTLLNMCLPFELRFVGTFLEELGKRDFQELRGAELRANSVPELTADVGAGAASDPRTRRKMALYVSLLRSCNFACATTLYDVMVSLERSGLLATLHGDLLEEILLLYTMALHHPAFTFDQKTLFGEILDRLKPESEPPVPADLHPAAVAPNLSVPPPNLQPPPGLVYLKSTAILQGPPSTNDQAPELGSPAMGVAQVLSELAHHPPPPPPPGLPLPHYSIPEYMGQPPWAGGLIVPALNPPIEVMNYPPRAPSTPLASSPADSRSGSPRAATRRPSRDRVSPPADPAILPLLPNFDNLTVSEMRRMDDERLRELGVPPAVVSQLRSVEKLNGVVARAGLCCAPPAPPPSHSHTHTHPHSHSHSHVHSHARSSGSDSGSSATSSPPGTPAPPPRRAPPGPPPPPSYPFLAFPRGFPPYASPHAAYRPPPPFANGEPYPGYAGFVPVLYAPPKLSCWNCGAAGHAGHDCKEPSMEEMTRAGSYQLDFGSAPPDPGDK